MPYKPVLGYRNMSKELSKIVEDFSAVLEDVLNSGEVPIEIRLAAFIRITQITGCSDMMFVIIRYAYQNPGTMYAKYLNSRLKDIGEIANIDFLPMDDKYDHEELLLDWIPKMYLCEIHNYYLKIKSESGLYEEGFEKCLVKAVNKYSNDIDDPH